MTVFDEEKRDLVPCSVKNFNLHEDLAQLDYMFCDKTGTLTQNELIFKAFKILGPVASRCDVVPEECTTEEERRRDINLRRGRTSSIDTHKSGMVQLISSSK